MGGTGGEEDRRLRCSRPLPHQDQEEASHKSLHEGDLWRDEEDQGEASKDGCESLCSCRTKGPGLLSILSNRSVLARLQHVPEASVPWESHSTGLGYAAFSACSVKRFCSPFHCTLSGQLAS